LRAGMSKFRVTVFKNGSQLDGKVLMVSESDAIEEVRKRAAEKLFGTSVGEEGAIKIFTSEGGEIEDAAEMCPNDVLYVAIAGEEFVSPTENSTFSPPPVSVASAPSDPRAKEGEKELERYIIFFVHTPPLLLKQTNKIG